MAKTINEMVREAVVSEMVSTESDTAETIDLIVQATAAGHPEEAGMDALRARGAEPLRIWTVRGPKGVGGKISAVFCQATSEVLILHQFPSGKFTLFAKEA